MRPLARAPFASLSLLALCVGLGLGCSSGREDEDIDEGAAVGLDALPPLPVATEESPSALAPSNPAAPRTGTVFDFCSEPPAPSEQAPFQLRNAAWLGMFAANEYGHLGRLAPQLVSLGFGSEADKMWGACAEDLGKLVSFEAAAEAAAKSQAPGDAVRRGRAFEAAKAGGAAGLVAFMLDAEQQEDGALLGACSREFFSASPEPGAVVYRGVGRDGGVRLPSQAFRDYLVRTKDDANWIEFFSAQPYTWLERIGFGRGSTQAFIARHATQPVIVIAFRGTEPPTSDNLQIRQVVDVLKDLDSFKTELSDYGFHAQWGYAHRGFTNALQSIDNSDGNNVPLLTQKLEALTKDNPSIGIWVTGHSLGGAVATLMAARILDMMEKDKTAGRRRFNLRGLYTFGSPMVGNDVFQAKLEASARENNVTLARFRNDQDPVTRVPGVMRILNYHHAGRLAWLKPTAAGASVAELIVPNADAEQPPYAGWSAFVDHTSAGIDVTTRQFQNGYYSRIVSQLRSNTHPELSTCAR